MIAEIYHKTSSRLEDELTGDFFGIMRYIPFQNGLKQLLEKRVKSKDELVFCMLAKIKENKFDFEFWKRSETGLGEIDGYLEIENLAIGIEVKYLSGLSGEDQLEREAGMLKEWCRGGERLLLLVADESVAQDIYLDNYTKKCFQKVHLGYITWQDMLLGLDDVITTTRYEEIMIEDLKELLREKGFVAFDGFTCKGLKINRGKYYEFG